MDTSRTVGSPPSKPNWRGKLWTYSKWMKLTANEPPEHKRVHCSDIKIALKQRHFSGDVYSTSVCFYFFRLVDIFYNVPLIHTGVTFLSIKTWYGNGSPVSVIVVANSAPVLFLTPHQEPIWVPAHTQRGYGRTCVCTPNRHLWCG